jgi:hypothetical protein
MSRKLDCRKMTASDMDDFLHCVRRLGVISAVGLMLALMLAFSHGVDSAVDRGVAPMEGSTPCQPVAVTYDEYGKDIVAVIMVGNCEYMVGNCRNDEDCRLSVRTPFGVVDESEVE